MKVLLINGSPNQNGCTNRALEEVKKSLNEENVQADIKWIGRDAIRGCQDCGACKKIGKCVYDDIVNEVASTLEEYDGFVFGTPVYYASASGQITSFMDRLFFSSGKKLKHKPASIVVSARRSGTTAAFDQLNKYLSISSMPIITSSYWNNVHGNTKEEVEEDLEGLQTMRNLGKNMSYILKCIEAGKEKSLKEPIDDRTYRTNFIR